MMEMLGINLSQLHFGITEESISVQRGYCCG